MVIKKAEDLRALVNQILLAAGASERNAGGVADHLVAANLAGVDTHGIHHLGGYVKMINDGVLVPTAANRPEPSGRCESVKSNSLPSAESPTCASSDVLR